MEWAEGICEDYLYDIDDCNDTNTYQSLEMYKLNTIPNSKLLSYNVKVDKSVSNIVRSWSYHDTTTLSCIVYNLISSLRKGCKLVYSRNNTSTNKVKSNKKEITVYRVKKCVDWMEQNGYIVNHIGIGAKKVENRVPSYIEPTDKFKSIWEEKQWLKAELDYIEQCEAIELRDKDKNKIDYRSNKVIAHMAETVRKINKVNEKAVVTDRDGNQITNIYCRVFNETFDCGGRFYRADILAMKNKDENEGFRLDVKIDGEQVAEVDFSNLHFRIASCLEDIDTEYLPLDVYSGLLEDETNAIDRKIVKLAVNIMFNSIDESKAQGAINKEILALPAKDKKKYTLGAAKSVMALIKDGYPDFAMMFCNGDSFGRTLQNHDSHLASDILEVFVNKEIPCLPVHDSFIVQMKYMDLLCDTMGDCFRKRFGVDDPVPVGIKWRDDLGNVIEKKVNV
ncbi:hypothetical protein D3C85_717540 [compost metagenome]